MNINELEFENVGSWPAIYRIVTVALLCILLIAVFFYFITIPQLERLAVAKEHESTLKKEFTIKAALSSNLEAYQAQMVEINLVYKGLLQKLPSKKEVARLLDDISFIGEGNRLQFKSISWGVPKEHDLTVEVPISLKVVGTYHELGAFVADIAALPRIVILNNMRLVKDKDGQLILNVVAKTYRYKGGSK